MPFRMNSSQQISLDSCLNVSEQTGKTIRNSWAEPFSENAFPQYRRSALPYCTAITSSSGPIRREASLWDLMIRELMGLPDDELPESICCDVRFQYDLHTAQYDEQPVSGRTSSRFRERLLA